MGVYRRISASRLSAGGLSRPLEPLQTAEEHRCFIELSFVDAAQVNRNPWRSLFEIGKSPDITALG